MKKIVLVIVSLFVVAIVIYGFTTFYKPSVDLSKLQQTEKLDFKIDTVASGLISPWAMVWLKNGDLLFTEKGGELRIIRDGQLMEKPVSGLPEIYVRGQGGLLDLELHPDYENNRWIYISYSSSPAGDEGGNTTLMRARVKDHTLIDKKVIFKAEPNTTRGQHFGGRIEFDNEGYLYLSVGERGEREKAQRLDTYNGKIFRLNDDGSVPTDNPFVDKKGAIGAIYSYGHRNPQGLVFDKSSGIMWEHEHGPRGGDEVNIVEKGKNYGWPEITYGINYSGTIITKDTAKAGMEQPVIFWRPSIAPCGMEIVTSDKYPGWEGDLLVGSLKFQHITRCDVQGRDIVHQEKLLEGIGRVRSVRQGPDGYIYVSVEGTGLIVRLMPVNS